MSEESEDKDSKTEAPSEKKLDEAIEKGQVAYSREVTSFLMLLTLCIVTTYIIPFTANKIALDLRKLIEHAGDCLLYTSPSPRDRTRSRMPSSA